ncbi:hypothetical protein M404DRAFT_996644 [Pisolithus tinctorius Marx 270]|uniref:Uncharacterized protein n=1 Tax=Pisolithus tinctorius Marx 270 TaxID=870435 RepID=A0A0C3P8I2_PISTI|nr:hypothetical protein M404DRAFT_996644 [Pisolithus tinctorius Marx 270]
MTTFRMHNLKVMPRSIKFVIVSPPKFIFNNPILPKHQSHARLPRAPQHKLLYFAHRI